MFPSGQDPGSFYQMVDYHLTREEIASVVRMSLRCWQVIVYQCQQSALSTFAWWTSYRELEVDWECEGRCNCDSRSAQHNIKKTDEYRNYVLS